MDGRSALREVEQLLVREGKTEALAALLVFSRELDAMSLFDPKDGRILDVNDAWLALYGYSRDEALAMHVTDVSAEPSSTVRAIGALGANAATRIDVRWHKAKDGTVFPVEISAGSLQLGGRPVMYAVMRDITQRQRAEDALARSEASYRALIEAVPDALLVHRHGRVVYVNPAARRMLGHAEDEIVGTPVLDIVHPEDRERVAARIAEVVTLNRSLPPLEERLVRKDGAPIVAEVSAYATVYDGEPATIVLARDVTARRQMEAQLVLNDRLASIGRLAASVGHELNNPLAYVLGNVAMLERELAREGSLPAASRDRLATHVRMIHEGAGRMRDIVNDLKTLARGEADERMPVDMQHVLDVCANMAEHETRGRARLVRDYRERLYVVANEARLGQVFLNLIVNAAQAIPEGAADANEVRVVLRSGAPGEVVVDVEDTGTGIAPEDAERIFEPFFTTKAGGTGLGLPVSHTIVTSLGGTLRAEPRPGGGTVFRVVLPAGEA